jgi:hypothetical protein
MTMATIDGEVTRSAGAASGTVYRALSGALLVAILLLAFWVSMQPWGLRWDFAQVYDTGHRVTAGEYDNLYRSTSPIEGQPPLGVMRFWSTPLAGVFYAPLSWFPPPAALRVYKLQNVAAYALALLLLVRFYLSRIRTGPPESRDLELLGFLCLVVVFQPFWTVFLVGGQTTPTVFLLLVAFVIAFGRGWTVLAAAAVTAVLLVKPAFVLMLPVFVVASEWRLLAAVAAWLACAGTASLAIFGLGPNLAFLSNAAAGLDATRLWIYNSSVPAFVHNFRLLWADDPGTLASARVWIGRIALLARLATAALLVYLWWRDGRGRLSGAAQRNYVALMSLSFFLLVSETIWEHYVTVLFIPATYVLARRQQFSRAAVQTILAALILSAAQNLYFALTLDRVFVIDSTIEVLLVGLYKSGPLLLLIWFLARYHREFVASQTDLRLSA